MNGIINHITYLPTKLIIISSHKVMIIKIIGKIWYNTRKMNVTTINIPPKRNVGNHKLSIKQKWWIKKKCECWWQHGGESIGQFLAGKVWKENWILTKPNKPTKKRESFRKISKIKIESLLDFVLQAPNGGHANQKPVTKQVFFDGHP